MPAKMSSARARFIQQLGITVLFILLPLMALADSEGGNFTYVAAATTDGTSYRGDRYAKCIPSGLFGTKGVTKILVAKPEQDVLLHSYDWYSPQIYLSTCNQKTSLVRFGPWHSGFAANTNDLALAFYSDGQLLKSFSTIEVTGRAANVSTSVSHYEWCRSVPGYQWLRSEKASSLRYGFCVRRVDGILLCFDVATGEMLKDWQPEFKTAE